ncbi:S-adenosyl-L-methionine-dependent methyltransferase [Dichotomocladium elegans]|nr:S-adenosyl-L-methionine-dependent methyltransferase [Dichotomocladium elegans]
MSPPCQPYTRVGLQQGSQDARSKSFLHLLNVLEKMTHQPKFILVENVKGFEESDSRDMLTSTLEHCGYTYQEFLLTPLQLGIPNSRMRYYLLAKRKPMTFALPPTGTILGFIPKSEKMPTAFTDNRTASFLNEAELLHASASGIAIGQILQYLENDLEDIETYRIPDKVLLKHGHVFDIVKPKMRRSCCFTKGYYHYAEATGSILQMNEELNTTDVFDAASRHKANGEEDAALGLLRSLELRYFTPREVSNLMGFPASFDFPETSTLKQKYRTLGNSINVRLVAELMVYLMKDTEE